MINKCPYYDNGYCKNKNTCSMGHPSQDCDGQCQDRISCPMRHRKNCRNGDSCIYLASNSCEFIHENIVHNVDTTSIETLKQDIYNLRCIVNKMDSKLTSLDLIVREVMSNIQLMTTKVNSEDMDIQQNNIEIECMKCLLHFMDISEYNNHKDSCKLQCPKCDKFFQNKNNLNIHIRKFHELENGDATYECDVCWAPLSTKSNIRKHKRNDHCQCKTCETFFKDNIELNDHMIKTHRGNNRKHLLEREPSLRNHKIKKIDSDIVKLFVD